MNRTLSAYFLTTTRGGKTTRYPSAWKMSSADAATRGLTEKDIVPGTTEERKDHGLQSAGHNGARGQRSD